jgi:hypothetical protein
MAETKARVEAEYATTPDVAPLVPIKIDRLRLLVRRLEQQLLADGIITVVGGRRLIRLDRLDALRAAIGVK